MDCSHFTAKSRLRSWTGTLRLLSYTELLGGALASEVDSQIATCKDFDGSLHTVQNSLASLFCALTIRENLFALEHAPCLRETEKGTGQ